MMRKTPKIAAMTTGLVLLGGATAAAVDTPDAAENGLTVAEGQVDTNLPASRESHPGGKPDSITVTADAPDAADHGVTVADTAQATESGPGKGAVVAAVASDGRAGGATPTAAGAPVATPNDGGIDTASAASDGASDEGAAHAAEQAHAVAGNAASHRP